MAFYSLPLGAGDVILTAAAEYSSNYLAYLQIARRSRPSSASCPTTRMARPMWKPCAA
ncbi:MAG: hypothetical protein U1F47_05230 [Hyphomicrobiales bacterium]